MITRSEIVEIGYYNKSHGIGGEISATITMPDSALSDFSCLISDIDGIFVPFFIEASRPKTAETMLLKISGIDNEQEALLLAGKPIFVLKKEWSEVFNNDNDEEELPIDCFVGFEVQCNGQDLGKITSVDFSTANALFEICADDSGKSVILPAADDFITSIDIEHRILAMSVPSALLSINE